MVSVSAAVRKLTPAHPDAIQFVARKARPYAELQSVGQRQGAAGIVGPEDIQQAVHSIALTGMIV